MKQVAIELQPYLEHSRRDGREHQVSGDVRILPGFEFPHLGVARDVLVYLPPSYARDEQSYPVFYMQDGQNLFDDMTAFAGEDWHVDETMERLGADGYNAIVVGIPHGGEQRLVEYNPFPGRASSRGASYVTFLADTLKPAIDSVLRTRPEPAATGILGSSMGGLISLYAFFERPDVFGLVGAMSPSLFVGRGAILHFVRDAPFNPGRIYLDHGTREPSARAMHDVLYAKGYRTRRDLKYVTERGGTHHESAWARRLPGAVRFLLKDWKERKADFPGGKR